MRRKNPKAAHDVFLLKNRSNFKERIDILGQKIDHFIQNIPMGKFFVDFESLEKENSSESDEEIDEGDPNFEKACDELRIKRNTVEGESQMKMLEKFSKNYVQIKNIKTNQKINKESGPFSFVELDDSLYKF